MALVLKYVDIIGLCNFKQTNKMKMYLQLNIRSKGRKLWGSFCHCQQQIGRRKVSVTVRSRATHASHVLLRRRGRCEGASWVLLISCQLLQSESCYTLEGSAQMVGVVIVSTAKRYQDHLQPASSVDHAAVGSVRFNLLGWVYLNISFDKCIDCSTHCPCFIRKVLNVCCWFTSKVENPFMRMHSVCIAYA